MKCSLRALVAIGLVVATSACVKVDTGPRAPTMGAELIDLVRAKEMGSLTEQEFEELRRKVLASF